MNESLRHASTWSEGKKQQRQEIRQIKSIIDEYEKKLDSKVNQVVNNMLTYTIKNNDIALPEIRNQPKGQRSFSYKKQRLKGQSLWSKTKNTKMQQTIKQKAESFICVKDPDQSGISFDQSNRKALGKQTYKRPKIIKRQVQVLTKQMRWNPFYQKNIIKAKDLQLGMLTLLQRGKIGKDVDIITAFQKGRPMLNLQPAIFHHVEEKFNKEGGPTARLPKQLIQFIHKTQKSRDNNNWAITAPPQQNYQQDRHKPNKETVHLNQQLLKQQIFIQFLHYQVVKNENYSRCKSKYLSDWSNIQSIFYHISKFLREFNHEIIFTQFNKILLLSTINRKPTHHQLQNCVLLSKSDQNIPLRSIKNIKNIDMKKKKAKEIIYSFTKLVSLQKKYRQGQHRHKILLKMSEWIKNGKIRIKTKLQISKQRIKIRNKYDEIQKKFKQQYSKMLNQKHYEIHIVNTHSFTNSKFKEIQNTEIIRIFNLQNPNLNIIYLCTFELNNDAISYYYKIMELEEIQNYKERVTFLWIDPQHQLSDKLSLSKKLYYSSKALRALMNKIKQFPSYLMISYPSEVDINLSVYLNIPILSGNLYEINPLQQRTLTHQSYPVKTLKSLKINPHSIVTVVELTYQIMKFCEGNKNCHRFVIKLNDHYGSSGIALLGYPFVSTPEMYNLTNVINTDNETSDSYFKKLAKFGGIVQKYQQNIYPVVVTACIHADLTYQITGTFDKVSFGFVNIGYIFPQKTVSHRQLIAECNPIFDKLIKNNHFGYAQITFFCDNNKNIFLEKVQCYNTRIGSSLFYFKFLSGGFFNSLGEFMTKIVDDEYDQSQNENMATVQQRQYCYLPFVLHFGLSDRQANSFFQLCRIGGVSFDLQNKYGSTFILLGTLKSCLGIITTAKQRQNVLKLMLSSLDFIMKQNSHNISNEMLKEKQQRMKQRTNISSIKEILEGFL